MTFWELPPVGRKVDFNAGYVQAPSVAGYGAYWLNSGTAALALALRIAREHAGRDDPEVILPAYGCPDLVAAAVYAGVKPVLVDIGENDPGYNLDALREALNPDVVAVVAVNFLGIAERLHALRSLVNAQASTLLIEDNAQWFPETALTNAESVQGDLVLTSFGRGKPVNLMGGGALWVKSDLLDLAYKLAPSSAQSTEACSIDLRTRTKGAIFNLALNPRVYYWLSRLPGLGVGKTEYHTVEEITGMPAPARHLLGAHIASYVGYEDTWRQVYDQGFRKGLHNITALPLLYADRTQRLLRYPLLYTGQDAQSVVTHLRNRKFGISGMYQQPLIDIPGVRPLVAQAGGNAGARSFASRLFTLPAHGGVTTKITKQILAFIEHQTTTRL